MTIIKRIRSFINWLWLQEGSSAARSRGIAVGVFSGCFPVFGFQTFLGVLLARLVKGNLLLAGVSTWISNPLTYFPLYWLNYKIGAYLLRHENQDIIFTRLQVDHIWSNGWLISSRLLIGSLISGLFCGTFAGLISYYIFKSKDNRL